MNLVHSCIVAERFCEVEERRPLQPNSLSSQSNQDTENDHKTINEQGPTIPDEDNRKQHSTSADNNSMEINDQHIPMKKEHSRMEEKPLCGSENLTRKRKQRAPSKVVSRPTLDDDDDITDDETQTYSIDDNVKGNVLGYEEKFSQNLTMESSSPVF